MEAVGEGLIQLEKKVEGCRAEALKENEAFISTVMHANQVALRDHRRRWGGHRRGPLNHLRFSRKLHVANHRSSPVP
jgi:hypothetical protein